MANKMYSAFISSAYESLRDERSLVIESLLDYRVFPICMEHFTASSSGRFSDIEELIDDSDFFILLLGSRYGSCDENGISWTEREYDYAVDTGKMTLALICDELSELIKLDDRSSLSEDQLRQIAFCEKISFARTITKDLPIPRIIGQFFSPVNFERCAGWVRTENEVRSQCKLEKWQQEHMAYNLAGTWYHVHLSAGDPNYIRTGKIQISQQFDPDNYKKLRFEGLNYNVKYDKIGDKLNQNMLKRTRWTGEYDINEAGEMFGLFHSKREFSDKFNEQVVEQGTRRGIHDFTVDVSENNLVEFFHGEFHDEAPSPKFGFIYAFRSEQARLDFLKENFAETLENII